MPLFAQRKCLIFTSGIEKSKKNKTEAAVEGRESLQTSMKAMWKEDWTGGGDNKVSVFVMWPCPSF